MSHQDIRKGFCSSGLCGAVFFHYFFSLNMTDAHVRAVISESAATKQTGSVTGAGRTATVRQRTTRWGPRVHTEGLTPFSTSESLSTRTRAAASLSDVQRAYSAAGDHADEEFSTSRKSSPGEGFVSSRPADFSATVTEQLLLCSQMPFSRCHFPSRSERQRLGENLESKRAWKSISWGFDLLRICSLRAPCDQHYGSVLRLTPSSISSKPAWVFPPGKTGWPSSFISNFFLHFLWFTWKWSCSECSPG